MATASKALGAAPARKQHLTLFIVGAIVAAVIVSLVFPHFATSLHIGGEIFLRLLKMMVVPLVMASVMSGILGLGDVRKLGRPGGYTVLYYISTTILAVVVGLVVVNVVRPGDAVDRDDLDKVAARDDNAPIRQKLLTGLAAATGVSEDEVAVVLKDFEEEKEETPAIGMILRNLLLMLFTDNLFLSASETNLLPLIVFAIIFASMLTTLGKRVEAITKMIGQVNDALMSFVLLLMKVAPIGIFCLVAARFGEAQAQGQFLAEIGRTGWYFATVLLGLGIHGLVTLPLIYWIFTRKNPYRFRVH